MPFAPELDDLYVLGIREVCENLGLVVERADEVEHNGMILDVILSKIREATVIVAEVSAHNPNVYYETGFAHALGKPVVVCSRAGSERPFDVSGINHVIYGSIVDFKGRFRSRLEATIL